MGKRNFNAAAPTESAAVLYETVELGWEHTIVDGRIEYTLDTDGQHVPRTYDVPVTLAAGDMLRATKEISAEAAARLARGEVDLEVTIEMVGAVLGGDVVKSIAADRTVTTDAFVGFLTWVLELWGMAAAIPGNEVPADPLGQGPSGSHSA